MKGKKFEIVRAYPVGDVREFSIEFDGYSYLVIYGVHVNGGFCAIPGYGIACELSGNWEDAGGIFYNAQRIGKALRNPDAGEAIARAIAEYEKIQKSLSVKGV